METKNKKEINADGNSATIGAEKMTPKLFLMRYNVLIIFVALFIISAIISPVFLTKGNVTNVLNQQSTYVLIALGMLLTMLTGGIDLSVSSIAAMGSIMVAVPLVRWGFSSGGGVALAILISIAICSLIGAVNGFLVAKLKMPAFIVTLATMTAVEGVAYMITGGAPVQLDVTKAGSEGLVYFGQNFDPLFGIPYPVYVAIVLVIIFYFIMNYMSFGRLTIASGSNATAVRLAGINVKKYQFWVYVISGALSAIAGIIITARASIATPETCASDYNLSTIAGVVIGGTSLAGGEGSVLLSVVGVFVIALIGNIMNLMSLAAYPQLVVKGVIIILAVLLKSFSDKK